MLTYLLLSDDQALLKEWLESVPVATYSETVKRQHFRTEDDKTRCKAEFTRLFLSPRRQKLDTDNNRHRALFLYLGFILRVAASFMKKAFSDHVDNKSLGLIAVYILAETLCWAHLALKSIQLLNPKRFNFRLRLGIAFLGLLALLIDGGTQLHLAHRIKYDRQVQFSVIFLVFPNVTFHWNELMAAVQEIRSTSPSGRRRYAAFNLLFRGKPNDELLWKEISADYKEFALDKLLDHVTIENRDPASQATIQRLGRGSRAV